MRQHDSGRKGTLSPRPSDSRKSNLSSHDLAHKAYAQAYQELVQLSRRQAGPSMLMEERVVADVLNFKLCRAAMAQDRFQDALAQVFCPCLTPQFEKHYLTWRDYTGPPQFEFQHFRWLSLQVPSPHCSTF